MAALGAFDLVHERKQVVTLRVLEAELQKSRLVDQVGNAVLEFHVRRLLKLYRKPHVVGWLNSRHLEHDVLGEAVEYRIDHLRRCRTLIETDCPTDTVCSHGPLKLNADGEEVQTWREALNQRVEDRPFLQRGLERFCG